MWRLLMSRRRLGRDRAILAGNDIWGKEELSPATNWRHSLLFRLEFSVTVSLLHVEEMAVNLLHMCLAGAELLEPHVAVNTGHKVPLSDPSWTIPVMRHHTRQREKA
jgi:hypothetical protein